MILLSVLAAAIELSTRAVERIPAADPEIRRMRVEARIARRALRDQQRHEERIARLTRPR